jgi:alpha-beta hydrolase superfamily lysophospholipase
MPVSRQKWLVAIALLVAGIVLFDSFGGQDWGRARFFADQTYHFQALRVLNDVAADGADIADVLETVTRIRSGDAQGWFRAWTETGDRAARLAEATTDRVAKGRALLRAHTYYRTAEFFLAPNDAKRRGSTARNTQSFYAGLGAMGIAYEQIKVPYEGHRLDAVYYPSRVNQHKSALIVIGGGFDSTLEELYFLLGKDALEHGYDVLTYDGPGQGSALRDEGLTFTPEWEKPTRAVMDTFLAGHARSGKIVLVGTSMGGYLAPRAAAFDARIDGVVAWDVMFDMGAVARRYAPAALFWLREHGFGSVVDLLIRAKATLSPGFAWAIQNGMWTLGTKHPLDTVKAMQAYSLADVAGRIKGDVLILAGAEDHFVPLIQVAQLEKALTAARSVTTVVYDRASGGAEHCQLGAQALWHATFFDWVTAKFPDTAGAAQ